MRKHLFDFIYFVVPSSMFMFNLALIASSLERKDNLAAFEASYIFFAWIFLLWSIYTEEKKSQPSARGE